MDFETHALRTLPTRLFHCKIQQKAKQF